MCFLIQRGRSFHICCLCFSLSLESITAIVTLRRDGNVVPARVRSTSGQVVALSLRDKSPASTKISIFSMLGGSCAIMFGSQCNAMLPKFSTMSVSCLRF
ncbi:hypothetical protein DFH08DRAFT_862209, partial [Mycena albidolilacea]